MAINWEQLERRARSAMDAGDKWHTEMPLLRPEYVLGMMYAVRAADEMAAAMLRGSQAEDADADEQAAISREVRTTYARYVKVRNALEQLSPRNLGEGNADAGPADQEN